MLQVVHFSFFAAWVLRMLRLYLVQLHFKFQSLRPLLTWIDFVCVHRWARVSCMCVCDRHDQTCCQPWLLSRCWCLFVLYSSLNQCNWYNNCRKQPALIRARRHALSLWFDNLEKKRETTQIQRTSFIWSNSPVSGVYTAHVNLAFCSAWSRLALSTNCRFSGFEEQFCNLLFPVVYATQLQFVTVMRKV